MGTGPGRVGAWPPLKPLEGPGRAVLGPEWRDQPRTGFRGLGRVLVERWPLSRCPCQQSHGPQGQRRGVRDAGPRQAGQAGSLHEGRAKGKAYTFHVHLFWGEGWMEVTGGGRTKWHMASTSWEVQEYATVEPREPLLPWLFPGGR